YLMQPSVFFTKEFYKKYGPFGVTSDFVTEYELWLKFSKEKMPTVVDEVISKFRIEENTKTKKMFNKLLIEDRKIASKYTSNKIILALHDLNNYFRKIVAQFV
ncbi:MAG: hypothetical protein GYA62_13335, partial [Bacteroidales bacterium]|nr:hypothetical protein [Bacteroidales bacterium]